MKEIRKKWTTDSHLRFLSSLFSQSIPVLVSRPLPLLFHVCVWTGPASPAWHVSGSLVESSLGFGLLLSLLFEVPKNVVVIGEGFGDFCPRVGNTFLPFKVVTFVAGISIRKVLTLDVHLKIVTLQLLVYSLLVTTHGIFQNSPNQCSLKLLSLISDKIKSKIMLIFYLSLEIMFLILPYLIWLTPFFLWKIEMHINQHRLSVKCSECVDCRIIYNADI